MNKNAVTAFAGFDELACPHADDSSNSSINNTAVIGVSLGSLMTNDSKIIGESSNLTTITKLLQVGTVKSSPGTYTPPLKQNFFLDK